MKESQHKNEYLGRINQSITFIESNLDKELNLAIVAKIAFYFPFHRLFSSVTNETVNEFITRRRIEKAAFDLMRDKSLQIADIFTKYGFLSNASFSKVKKQQHNISEGFSKSYEGFIHKQLVNDQYFV